VIAAGHNINAALHNKLTRARFVTVRTSTVNGTRIEMSLQSARTFDGTQIVYRLLPANGDRPRMVLIHSLVMDHSFWDPVTELLSDKASILVFDCRGHGASGKPPGPYTVELSRAISPTC
jgi:pimeloyl-ACP methyl ester carboxylesterase